MVSAMIKIASTVVKAMSVAFDMTGYCSAFT